jgi:hypothetical protein
VYELQLDGQVATLEDALKAALSLAASGAGAVPKKIVDSNPS